MTIDYTSPCPWCGRVCECDLVNVGPGFVQAGPYHCEHCNASEIGPYDDTFDPWRPGCLEKPRTDKTRILTEAESKAGWYAPETGHGSSANVIGGRVVGHKAMEQTYRAEFVGNPLWQDADYVSDWWENVRK